MLQRILVVSYAARVIAVRQVTSTSGAKTPGVDGVVWDSPEKKDMAVAALINATGHKYQAAPVRQVMIPKPNKPGELRPLGIPTLFDRGAQAL